MPEAIPSTPSNSKGFDSRARIQVIRIRVEKLTGWLRKAGDRHVTRATERLMNNQVAPLCARSSTEIKALLDGAWKGNHEGLWNFRRWRRDIVRSYFMAVRQDFSRLIRLTVSMIVHLLTGTSKTATDRVQQRLRFALSILLIRVRVLLFELGCGTVNLQLIAALINLTRNELAMLASTLEACIEQESPTQSEETPVCR